MRITSLKSSSKVIRDKNLAFLSNGTAIAYSVCIEHRAEKGGRRAKQRKQIVRLDSLRALQPEELDHSSSSLRNGLTDAVIRPGTGALFVYNRPDLDRARS